MLDAMKYTGKPDLSSEGFHASPEISEASLWVGAPDENEPYQPAVELQSSIKAAESPPINYPIVFNVERWDLDQRSVGATEAAASRDKMVQIFDWASPILPQQQYGLYAFLPIRDYFVGGDPGLVPAWQSANDLLAPLVANVRALFPSLYTFYDDPEGWVAYAQANIAEAQRIADGRPIYPFLWPQYHTSAPGGLAGTFIAGDYWRLQLETVHASGADGIVIWSDASQAWNAAADWWLETLDFIAGL